MIGEPKTRVVEPTLEQLRELSDVGRAVTYATSLDEVATLTLERGVRLLDAPAAVLMLADEEGELHVRATHGIDEVRVTRFSAPLDDELIGRLQGLLGVPDELFLAVPLVATGAVTGLLAMARRTTASAADEWLLSALADQAAVALENARVGGEVRTDMQARLQASEGATHAKDRALATLAHDIRSPLGAIEAYCELLEDGLYGEINSGQRGAVGRVRMSGRHLLSLLDNVMDMARLNAGVVRVRAEPVRITDVAREAVDMLVPAADARQQTLQLGKRVKAVVTGDHAQLRQVLVNVIGNAIKFTPRNGRIIVSTSIEEEAGVRFGVIRVSDTGPGIAESERAAIFEPFYRSEDTSGAPGVGLGLAISHAIVVEMGGTLEAGGIVGTGSVFVLRLPLLDAAAEDAV